MQAPTEHQLVLSPSSDVPYCAFSLIFTSQVDESKYAPRIILSVQNPRVILLFRFVSDVFQAIGIINSAVESQTKLSDNSEVKKQNGASDTAFTPNEASIGEQNKPLNFILQVQNISLILPTAQTTRTVISSSVDDFVFAIPGDALPGIVLEDASLPCLVELMEESTLCEHTYLYSDFCKKGTAAATQDDGEETKQKTDSPEIMKTDLDVEKKEESTGKDASKVRNAKSSSRKRSKLSGVLLFEENYSRNILENERSGVLRLPTGKSGHSMLYNSDIQDNILAKPAAFAQKVLGSTLRGLNQEQLKEARIEKEEDVDQDVLPDETEVESEDLLDPIPDSSQATMAFCLRNLRFLPGVLVNIPRVAILVCPFLYPFSLPCLFKVILEIFAG